MKIKLRFLISLLVITSNLIYSQSSLDSEILKGKLYDSLNNVPLSFATIYNKNNKLATISNFDGYFEIPAESFKDSIVVSYLGYKTKLIALEKGKLFYEVYMQVNQFELKEVIIKPKNYNYLIDLILESKKKGAKEIIDAKGYYQLKSFIDENQVELVESFYNVRILGYDLISTKLKAGQIGLKQDNNIFFASLESSKPIIKHRLFSVVDNFPKSPLQLNKNKILKSYFVELYSEFINKENDSIKVLSFVPKNDATKKFNCKVWLNASDTAIIKVELSGNNLYEYPIVSLYEKDILLKKNLTISKTFNAREEGMVLEHVDFKYDFKYQRENGEAYLVNTEAVFYSFDYNNTFDLPIYKQKEEDLSDYQSLSFLPYNNFFWENNKELKINYDRVENEEFLKDPSAYTNKFYNNKIKRDLSDFFNYSSIEWSEKRIIFKDLEQYAEYEVNQPSYRLIGKILIDINTYKDSTDVLIKSIFDNYESYYLFNLDLESNCMINMFFDLIEIEKRKLESKIRFSDLEQTSIIKLHAETELNIEEIINIFFADVEIGRNKEGMLKWNKIIKKELGIDNLYLFQLYQPIEEEN